MSHDYANPDTYRASVPLSEAIAAHAGISFSPEERAAARLREWCAVNADTYRDLRDKHAPTPELVAKLDAEWERFQARSVTLYRNMLRADSRCMSTMITGPANFPTDRNDKRNRIAHKRCTEYMEHRKAGVAAIVRELHPELRPVMSGDADAVDRLSANIAAAEKAHAIMLAVNKAMRAHAAGGEAAQVPAMVAAGITEAQARELLKADFAGRLGFADYVITNSGANIRRLKARLGQVTRLKAAPAVEATGTAATVEEVPADNRVRLRFPGIPAADVRASLKSNGFRWTPSLGVWQAYHNPRTVALARSIAGVTHPEAAGQG